MRNAILFIFLFSCSTLYSQIQLELDSSFSFGKEGPSNYLITSGVRKVKLESNGNMLINQLRCYNPGNICGNFHRISSNGVLLPSSFILSFIPNAVGIGNYFKTQNGYLMYPANGNAYYKVNMQGNIGSSEALYNNTLRNTLNNANQMNGGTPYYNPNDGSLISYCAFNKNCFINSTDKLKRFLAYGTIDTSFNHTYDGFLFQILRFENDLFWCGGMKSYDSHYTPFLAKTDTLGIVDTSFQVDSRFDTLVKRNMEVLYKLDNGKLLVAGYHSEYVRASGIRDTLQFFRLNANGSLDTTFNNLESNAWRSKLVLNAVELPDKKLLVVGLFSEYGGYPYHSIAVLDSNGFALPNYLHLPKLNNSGLLPPDTTSTQKAEPSEITATLDGGYIIYGGGYDLVNQQPSYGLIKLKSFWPVNTSNLITGLKTLQLYPNPAQNQVRINLGQEINKPQTLYLRDISGKLVKTYSITEPNQTLDIGGVAKGLYFVSVSGFKVQKLVIQ